MPEKKSRRKRTSTGKVALYTRNGRWYADFSAYRTILGRPEVRVALKPAGQGRATTDAEEAYRIAEARESDLILGLHVRETGDPKAQRKRTTFSELVPVHLKGEDQVGEIGRQHRAELQQRMETAAEYFEGIGLSRPEEVTPLNVEEYRDWLLERPRDYFSAKSLGRDPKSERTLGPQTVIHYLNALSKLYSTASKGRYVPAGYNPVSEAKRPKLPTKEAPWLTVVEAAAVLETARRLYGDHSSGSVPFMYELVATLLLTGADLGPVRTMRIKDVDFEGRRIHIPLHTEDRAGLKTEYREREIPLWDQLAEILKPYVKWRKTNLPGGRLLFPEPRGDGGPKHKDFSTDPLKRTQAAVEAGYGAEFFADAAERIGRSAFKLRSKCFRHSYCAARLRTYEETRDSASGRIVWVAVPKDTVAREMGHGGHDMVNNRYGHQSHNPLKPVVEYRIAETVLHSFESPSENQSRQVSVAQQLVPVAQLDRATAS